MRIKLTKILSDEAKEELGKATDSIKNGIGNMCNAVYDFTNKKLLIHPDEENKLYVDIMHDEEDKDDAFSIDSSIDTIEETDTNPTYNFYINDCTSLTFNINGVVELEREDIED